MIRGETRQVRFSTENQVYIQYVACCFSSLVVHKVYQPMLHVFHCNNITIAGNMIRNSWFTLSKRSSEHVSLMNLRRSHFWLHDCFLPDSKLGWSGRDWPECLAKYYQIRRKDSSISTEQKRLRDKAKVPERKWRNEPSLDLLNCWLCCGCSVVELLIRTLFKVTYVCVLQRRNK